MSDRKLETGISEALSAFLDGEANPEEMHALLDELDRNPGLHALVNRHHQVRASLRGELYPGLDTGFAERVLAGIEATEVGVTAGSRVVSLPRTRHRPWLRGTFGLAMAASLAAVVVLAARTLLPPAEPVLSVLNTAQTTLPPASRSAEIEAAAQARSSGQPWNDLSPDAVAELNNYLISHNNSAMDHGLGGSMGFMRVAAGDGVDFGDTQR
jgi:negative regulator of sigma E activity